MIALIANSSPEIATCFTDSEHPLSVPQRSCTLSSWATQAGRFVFRAVSLWEDHVYFDNSNRLQHPQPAHCWLSVWNLSLTHCQWTCLGSQCHGWKPDRSVAVETGLVYVETNSNRFFHHYISDWVDLQEMETVSPGVKDRERGVCVSTISPLDPERNDIKFFKLHTNIMSSNYHFQFLIYVS